MRSNLKELFMPIAEEKHLFISNAYAWINEMCSFSNK